MNAPAAGCVSTPPARASASPGTAAATAWATQARAAIAGTGSATWPLRTSSTRYDSCVWGNRVSPISPRIYPPRRDSCVWGNTVSPISLEFTRPHPLHTFHFAHQTQTVTSPCPVASGAVCSGSGTCNTVTGVCACAAGFGGYALFAPPGRVANDARPGTSTPSLPPPLHAPLRAPLSGTPLTLLHTPLAAYIQARQPLPLADPSL